MFLGTVIISLPLISNLQRNAVKTVFGSSYFVLSLSEYSFQNIDFCTFHSTMTKNGKNKQSQCFKVYANRFQRLKLFLVSSKRKGRKQTTVFHTLIVYLFFLL